MVDRELFRRALAVALLAVLFVAWAPGQLPHPLDVATLNETTGLVLQGIDEGDWAGSAVSSAGDVNGDGYTDVIIGAPRAGELLPGTDILQLHANSAGEAYLIYGSPTPVAPGGVLSLGSLDGLNGVLIEGIDPADLAGHHISGAGDVNGDGYEDFLIGARQADAESDYLDPGDHSGAGEVYVIYGSASGIGIDGVLRLAELNGENGVKIYGIDGGDDTGRGLAGAGDFNGDGFADVLMGAWGANLGNGQQFFTGAAHLVFGSPDGIGTDGLFLTEEIDGQNGITFQGVNNATDLPDMDRTGIGVAGTGDANGDGFDDLLIGAPLADPGGVLDAGEVYLVYGTDSFLGTGGLFELSTLDGVSGVRLQSVRVGDGVGWRPAGAGDFNADGYSDLSVDAVGGSQEAERRAAYHVFGSPIAPGTDGLFSLESLDGTDGLAFGGITQEDYDGRAGFGGADLNGDGFGDLLIGAGGSSLGGRANAGAAFVIYGPAVDVTTDAVFSLASIEGTLGIRIDGATAGDRFGLDESLAGAGDFNGDGFGDIVAGASNAFIDFLAEGTAHVIFGDGTGTPGYTAFTYPGDAPRTGIGMIGDGSHSIPLSRVWVDYAAGDDGTGQASSTEVVFRRGGVSNFAPLVVDPTFEWEITTARQGFGTAQVTFKGLGVAGETDWQALLLRRNPGTGLWYAPPQTRNSLLHEITVDEDFAAPPARYVMLLNADLDPPVVQTAILNDANDNGIAEPGEVLSLLFDRGVVLGEVLNETAFELPVGGDSLGTGVSVDRSARNSRVIDITLGPGVNLNIAGDFLPGMFAPGSPSGIDLAPGLPPSALTSFVGVPAEPNAPVDLLFTLITGQQTIPATGGTVGVTPSPNARYSQHALTIPSGGLAGATTIALRPPVDNGGYLNAVQVSPDITFTAPATIRLEYLDSDIDTESGALESLVQASQLVEVSGELVAFALPGTQVVDTLANTVEIEIASTDPLSSSGPPGLFVTVGLPPIAERTIHIKDGGGSGAAVLLGATSATLTPDSPSIYASHQIEFPGYELTTASDPEAIAMTIRAVTPFERISTTGGTSFPTESGALFAVTARSATGEPVAFTDPVNITVQFFDGSNGNPQDVQPLGGTATIGPLGMRAVRDAAAGDAVSFARISRAIPQSVSLFTGGGLVTATGVQNLTGPTGKGVWGAAVFVNQLNTTDVGMWSLYR